MRRRTHEKGPGCLRPKTPKAKRVLGIFSILPIISAVLLSIDKLFSILLSSNSLETSERELQKAAQESLGYLLTAVLEAVDIRLMN